MNDAHFHLLINHFPIIGLILGTLVLFGGIIFKSTGARVSGLFLTLLSGAFAFPAFGSGEDAHELVEHMEGFTRESHDAMHAHYDKAETFMLFVWGIVILSLVSLFFEWKKHKFAKMFSIAALLVSGISIWFAHEVGNSGGKISHIEIRDGFKASEHEEHEEHEEGDEEHDNH